MKYLNEDDLQTLGIRDWGTRLALRESIRQYFSNKKKNIGTGISLMSAPTNVLPQLSSPRANMIGSPSITNENSLKRSITAVTSPTTISQSKKMKLGKKKIKFKDLEVLVSDPLIPVFVGTIVHCTGSNLKAEIVLNKHKKPMLKALSDAKEQLFTVPQFYTHATGHRLQAKGDSWSQVFFMDSNGGPSRSLSDLKWLIEGPKKAVSAFLYFSKEIRDTLPKNDFARKSGDLWKSLTEEKKQKYKMLEDADKIRFQREKAEWIKVHEAHRQAMGLAADGWQDDTS
eukprot:TRINITY_DN6870_c0_g3_i8.p1 TRINITY_DN6870_c0_g3~~TRINITY_DN6870_c0_g3_i8.p1  ORF type:complete len:285 (+),score=59.32 TRINITY_DN6870_c0_g3_i8:568-1422(+)